MCYVSLRSHVRRQLPAGEQAAPSQAATCLSVLREEQAAPRRLCAVLPGGASSSFPFSFFLIKPWSFSFLHSPCSGGTQEAGPGLHCQAAFATLAKPDSPGDLGVWQVTVKEVERRPSGPGKLGGGHSCPSFILWGQIGTED